MGAAYSLLALALGAASCGEPPLIIDRGFDVACGDGYCAWEVLEGTPTFGGSWHDGDPGADLSGAGRVVIQQRSGPAAPAPVLQLEAAIARDPQVTLAFEIEWFVAPAG